MSLYPIELSTLKQKISQVLEGIDKPDTSARSSATTTTGETLPSTGSETFPKSGGLVSANGEMLTSAVQQVQRQLHGLRVLFVFVSKKLIELFTFNEYIKTFMFHY